MICSACHGSGLTMRDSLPAVAIMPGDPDHPVSIWQPCQECGGCGIDRLCTEPETKAP